MALKRIPGGDFYITCCHIKSDINPRVFVAPIKNPPPQIRNLVDHVHRIDRTRKANWLMVCMDCVESKNLENGAPYDLRQAMGEITLGV